MVLPKKYLHLILKNVTILIFSAVFGFLINYNITMELVRRFVFITDKLQIPLGVFMLLFQIIIVFALIKLIIEREIDPATSKILWVCYSTMLLFLLFGRPVIMSSINLNPFRILDYLDNSDGIFVSLFNIAFFVPIGILFTQKKAFHILMFVIPIGFVVESIQYLFKLGIFDIDDIILNTLGVYIGFFIFKNLKKIKHKKTNSSTTSN